MKTMLLNNKKIGKDLWIEYIFSHKIILLELLGLTILAIIFRFYNYDNRWGLASDQARDALVAIEAVRLHTIPLTGPFSASGPFVFGPYMYWFLIFLRILFPFSFLTFWVGTTIGSVLMVLFTVLIGKEIKNTQFGFFLAFFAAISPAKIGMATNLISSTLAGYIATFAVYFFVRAIKHATLRDFFLLGLCVGVAINTHFQAIPLVVLFPIAWGFSKRNFKQILFLGLGCLIPFIPLIIFDFQTHFYESTHLFQYFFHNPPVQITNRWLTFAGQTIPQTFRLIIGGNEIIAYPLFILVIIFFAYLFIVKKVDRVIVATGLALLSFIWILRYFQGQLFGDFTAFLQTFVLIIVCYALWKFISVQKLIAIVIILIVAFSTIRSGYMRTSVATNSASDNAEKSASMLKTRYPVNTLFSLYDYRYQSSEISLPLSLYLTQENKTNIHGVKIGVSNTSVSNANLLTEEKYPYWEYIFDLSSYSDTQLKKMGWVSVDPKSVYDSVENWYK